LNEIFPHDCRSANSYLRSNWCLKLERLALFTFSSNLVHPELIHVSYNLQTHWNNEVNRVILINWINDYPCNMSPIFNSISKLYSDCGIGAYDMSKCPRPEHLGNPTLTATLSREFEQNLWLKTFLEMLEEAENMQRDDINGLVLQVSAIFTETRNS